MTAMMRDPASRNLRPKFLEFPNFSSPEYGRYCEVSSVHGVAGGHHVGGGERLGRQVGHRKVPVRVEFVISLVRKACKL